MKQSLILISLVTLLSSWTWSILSKNLFIGICCIILSFLMLISFSEKLIIPQRFLKLGIVCLWGVLIMYLFIMSFDKNLFQISESQYIKVLKRQEIYAREFNQFYRNRFGIYYFNTIEPFIHRYLINISNFFDLEDLFTSSYDEDKSKTRMPILFLPFLVTGFFCLLKSFNKRYAYTIIIILLISGLLNTKNTLGSIIIYPILYASVGLGLHKFFSKIR